MKIPYKTNGYLNRMKAIKKVQQYNPLDDFGFEHPLSVPIVIPCIHCGRKTELVQNTVCYCFMCGVGFIHPRYDWSSAKIL